MNVLKRYFDTLFSLLHNCELSAKNDEERKKSIKIIVAFLFVPFYSTFPERNAPYQDRVSTLTMQKH
jgi:hypothetical protein